MINSGGPLRKCLIISLQYPPSSMAGVHRARHLCNHLPRSGWEPALVTAKVSGVAGANDRQLLGMTRSDIDRFELQDIPEIVTRVIGVGDIGLRTMPNWKSAVRSAVLQAKPEVVFITSSPAYPMLLTSWIKREFNIPVVLDFQDPWVSAEGALRPRFSKGGIAHLLATIFEPRAVRHASYITSVSERQNDEMASRYPWLDRASMAAIPIGGDPDDFKVLHEAPPMNPLVQLDRARINLSYVGTFLPRAGPLVETLFLALKVLQDETPQLAARLLLNFVGTSNQPAGGGIHLVDPIAQRIGVTDLVREVPQRVPFLEALHILANSNGLMLIGSDEPHYTASKIYPALMSGTPFVSMFHQASSAHDILSRAGGGFSHSFETLDQLKALLPILKQNLRLFAEEKVELAPPNPQTYQDYTASSVAGRYASLFDEIIA